MTSKLALEGGTPVRTKPMPPRFVGASLFGEEEKKLLNEAIDSRTLFRHYGPSTPHFVNDLEREFKDFIGTRYTLATATGSGGYFCAMRALGIGPGDEVIIPALGWITDFSMIDNLGGIPVIASIDASFTMDPADFEAKITPKTKAVVIVYYQGGAANVDAIVKIARQHKIKVLEDNAQAIGCEFKGRKLGTWGDIACFSLQGNKVISSGDGGLIAMQDQELYELCVRYHDLGQLRETFKKHLEKEPMTVPISGYQWRMNELTGAVALAQLRKLPWIISTCRQKAGSLRQAISKSFPKLKFRAVDPANDIGILVAFDLGNSANEQYFMKAYEAEGLGYGPTSWCETLCDIPPVSERMKYTGRFTQETFDRTRAIDERMGKLAVLPLYTDEDMNHIAEGTVKVLSAMTAKGMI